MERAGIGTNEGIDIAAFDSMNPSGWLTPQPPRIPRARRGLP
jgi:hypothetical protein